MREINNLPFESDEDIHQIVCDSREYDRASHGGSVNNGDDINPEEILERYKSKAEAEKVKFQAFINELQK
jgi:hypothetical protein